MAYNNRADNVQKNPERVRRLMRSCARNQGSQVPNTVLAQDIAANDETQNNEETVASYHYRDKGGQECDAVVHLRNGQYGLIEIMLGGDTLIEEGAKSLKSMEAKIDTDKMNVPPFLMVLTGTGDWAYRRHDGVYVVPIGCLKN